MTKATITIIGLGKVGSSIGLALKKPDIDYRVIGHDKESEAAKQAKGLNAVELDALEPD